MEFPLKVPLMNDTVIVWDYEMSSIIYSFGFFGKPLGLRKTKPGIQDRPLVLSSFETVYLSEYHIIQITLEDEIQSQEELINMFSQIYHDFQRKYRIYKYLRNKGYIVRPGMKFGSDFIIYEQGPGYDHSKWVVHVEKDDIKLQAINIVRAGRLAASVKKRYLISTITSEDEIVFYGFDRVKI
jgi:tRNA-intron endonuclease